MAKPMTKSATIAHLAQKTGLAKKQVVDLFEQLEALAIKEAKNVFVLPALRTAGAGQPQGADGPQSADRRADQDPGQARREVPAGQEHQGRGAWQEVRAGTASPSGPSRTRGARRESSSVSSGPGRRRPPTSRRAGARGRVRRSSGPLLLERAGAAGHAPRAGHRGAARRGPRTGAGRGSRPGRPGTRLGGGGEGRDALCAPARPRPRVGALSASFPCRRPSCRRPSAAVPASGSSAGAAAAPSGAQRAAVATAALPPPSANPRPHAHRHPRRWDRRRQAPAGPGRARPAADARPSSATRVTMRWSGGSTSRPTSTPSATRWAAGSTRTGAGGSAARASGRSERWSASASRPGSIWATAISPRTCTAPACCARGRR